MSDTKPLITTIQLPGGVPLEMVDIPAGSFNMGLVSGQASPMHMVTIGYTFHLGIYPVTQRQWFTVMNGFPRNPISANPELPVVNVSWDDCQTFIIRLNGLGLGTFRLPSEAEWEYACRAGTNTRWSHGDEETELDKFAWYHNNSGGVAQVVGQKLPNLFGIYDMHGNVWEWCQDGYHRGYTGAPADGSAWESRPTELLRVVRGGTYKFATRNLRSAYRYAYAPTSRYVSVGFRLVRLN